MPPPACMSIKAREDLCKKLFTLQVPYDFSEEKYMPINNIIEIIFGGIAGAAIPFALTKFPELMTVRKIRRKYFSLVGDWKGFHYTCMGGKALLIKGDWKIKPGLINPFVVDYKQKDLYYTGSLTLDGDDRAIINTKSQTQNETLRYIFRNPLNTKKDIIPGIWLSYDHDKSIASGGAILTQKNLTKAQAHKILKDCMKIFSDEDIPFIRIEP